MGWAEKAKPINRKRRALPWMCPPDLPIENKKIETVIEGDNLRALQRSLSDAAAIGTPIWLSYIFLMFYVAIAAGAVTHKDLLVESPVELPFLSIKLPLKAFFIVAPALFIVVHVYVLTHFCLLADKAREFHSRLKADVTRHSIRESVRQQLPINLFVQFLTGPVKVRDGPFSLLLWSVAWITLVAGPVLVLLLIELQFLPYHDTHISWFHRGLLAFDLIFIWLLWISILSGRNKDTLADAPGWILFWRGFLRFARRLVAVPLTLAIVFFSVLVATYPGEWKEWPYKIAPKLEPTPVTDVIFGRTDASSKEITGTWPANSLKLSEFDIYEALKVEGADKLKWRPYVFSLRGRHLEHADFRFARFDNIDLRDTFLDGALLKHAKLQKANLDRSRLRKASLDEADLKEASFIGAILPGASLQRAQLQGVWFDKASMQGASLSEAELQGASLRGAQLQAASLRKATLQGAVLGCEKDGEPYNLDSPDIFIMQATMRLLFTFYAIVMQCTQLQGASLDEANLQGASLSFANLKAASLTEAKLQGASLDFARAQGASLAGAELQGTSLVGAILWRSSWKKTKRISEEVYVSLDMDEKKIKPARIDSVSWEPLSGSLFDNVAFIINDGRITNEDGAINEENADDEGISEDSNNQDGAGNEDSGDSEKYWTDRDYINIQSMIRAIPDGNEQKLALERIKQLDCTRAAEGDVDNLESNSPLASCDPNAQKASETTVWQTRLLKANAKNNTDFEIELEKQLRKAICENSASNALFILKGMIRGSRLAATGSNAPSLIKYIESPACPIAAALSDSDKAELLRQADQGLQWKNSIKQSGRKAR